MKRKLLVLAALCSGCIPFDELEEAYRCDAGYEGCAIEPPADSGTTGETDGGSDAGAEVDAGAPDGGEVDAGFSCPSGLTQCEPQVCVDLSTNEANCGACGHDCMGGACSASKCQTVLLQQTFVPNPAFRPSLAVSNGQLAFSRSDCTVGVAATSPLANVTPLTDPSCNIKWLMTRVLFEASTVYWITDQEVGSWTSGIGARSADVNTGSQGRSDLVKAGSSLYWTDRAGGRVRKTDANLQSAVSSQDAGLIGEIAAITELDGGVYFSNRVFGFIYRMDGQLATGRITVARPGIALQLATCGGALYAAVSNADGGLMKVDVNDGGVQRVGGSSAPASAIACDSQAIYWSTLTGNDSTLFASRDGGELLTLASGQSAVEAVAVDDCCVYWYGKAANGDARADGGSDAGVIYRIRKPW